MKKNIDFNSFLIPSVKESLNISKTLSLENSLINLNKKIDGSKISYSSINISKITLPKIQKKKNYYKFENIYKIEDFQDIPISLMKSNTLKNNNSTSSKNSFKEIQKIKKNKSRNPFLQSLNNNKIFSTQNIEMNKFDFIEIIENVKNQKEFIENKEISVKLLLLKEKLKKKILQINANEEMNFKVIID